MLCHKHKAKLSPWPSATKGPEPVTRSIKDVVASDRLKILRYDDYHYHHYYYYHNYYYHHHYHLRCAIILIELFLSRIMEQSFGSEEGHSELPGRTNG